MNATMFFLLLFPCLALGGQADGRGGSHTAKEPAGGLMEIALDPGALSPQAGRYVRLLLDPKAKPPTYLFEVPGTTRSRGQDPDPLQRFRREMARIGAEAVIYLAYTGVAYVKILRFPNATEAESQWSLRRNAGESKMITIAGAEILFTKPGQMLRADLRAGMSTLECLAGRYWIRVMPAIPELGNPGLDLLLKQQEKLAKISEPGGSANRSQPVGAETNPASAADGSGR